MADIPGIIEGASYGKGLGLRFLRHIERNSCLLFMIPSNCKDINKEYNILIDELKNYNPELLDKDHLLVISKSDLIDSKLKKEISKSIRVKHLFISSITKKGISQLKDEVWKILTKNYD